MRRAHRAMAIASWVVGLVMGVSAPRATAATTPSASSTEAPRRGPEEAPSPPAALASPATEGLETLPDGRPLGPTMGELPVPSSEVGVSAGLGRGVQIRAADDRFSLTLRARMQVRFTQYQEHPASGEPASEFLVRRARLVLQGNAWGPALEYYVQLAFSNLDMEPDLRSPLRDANLVWRPLRDLQLRIGQMKAPFDRQRVISSSALQMVDRSVVVSELNLDRDVGLQLFSHDLFGLGGVLGYQLALMHGAGRNRLSTGGGLLYVARLQISPMGAFHDYLESDFGRSRRPRLSLGVGGALNHGTNRSRSTFDTTLLLGRTTYVHGEVDAVFKWAGVSLSAQAIYRRAADAELEREVDGELQRERTRSGWGWFAQAGYLFSFPIELTARVGDLRPLGVSAVARARELGGGLSWYIQEHALKVQADYFHLGGAGNPAPHHQARLQMQLFF